MRLGDDGDGPSTSVEVQGVPPIDYSNRGFPTHPPKRKRVADVRPASVTQVGVAPAMVADPSSQGNSQSQVSF